MGILLDSNSRLLIQGLGKDGAFQAQRMLQFGSPVVAAVHPNRSGQRFENTVPYFEAVRDAVAATHANVGVIFVPAPFAPDAILEQADAGIPLIVCITEGIPVQDMGRVCAYLKHTNNRLIGPNCPGAITPLDQVKAGIIPNEIVSSGNVGIVSRSGTLTYEAIAQLGAKNIGQSSCVGIGGDPVTGTSYTDVLRMFQADSATETIVLIGEIGGTAEQQAAECIRAEITKPVVAFIAGQSAPTGKRMGHAGAIVMGKSGLASEKMRVLREVGVTVAEVPSDIGAAVLSVLG